MRAVDPAVHSPGDDMQKVLRAPNLATIFDAAVAERWQRFARQAKKAQTNPTEKAVHDLRVATRRLLALLDMIKTTIPKSGGAEVRKRLKTNLKSLSALRDTQVQILRVRELAAGFGILSPFLGELITREAAEAKRAGKEINRIDLDTFGTYFDRLRKRLKEFLSDPALDDASLAILRGLLAQMYVKASFIKKGIPTGSGEMLVRCKKIHDLRLLFKQFRYTVEILKPVHPGISGRVLKRMSDYQSMMGAVQDTEVLASAISSHAKKVRKKEIKNGLPVSEGYDGIIAYLTDRIREQSDTFLASVDDLDSFWKRLK